MVVESLESPSSLGRHVCGFLQSSLGIYYYNLGWETTRVRDSAHRPSRDSWIKYIHLALQRDRFVLKMAQAEHRMNRCPVEFNDVWVDNCTCSAGQRVSWTNGELVRSLRVWILNGKSGKRWENRGLRACLQSQPVLLTCEFYGLFIYFTIGQDF